MTGIEKPEGYDAVGDPRTGRPPLAIDAERVRDLLRSECSTLNTLAARCFRHIARLALVRNISRMRLLHRSCTELHT